MADRVCFKPKSIKITARTCRGTARRWWPWWGLAHGQLLSCFIPACPWLAASSSSLGCVLGHLRSLLVIA